MTPDRWHQVCAAFDAAVRCEPGRRDALLAEACMGDPSSAPRLSGCWLPMPKPFARASSTCRPIRRLCPLRSPKALATASAPTRSSSPWARGEWAQFSSPSRANRSAAALHSSSSSQGWTRAGHRPLRRRAAGAGDPGSSQHRQGARRRCHREWSAVLRDGAGKRGTDYRVL